MTMPFVVRAPVRLKLQFFLDAAKTQEIVPTEQVVFDTSDHSKATVAAVDLAICEVTPISGNADGTPAPVTITGHLPASGIHSAFDATQDGTVQQLTILAATFSPA